MAQLALEILDGRDYRTMPRSVDGFVKAIDAGTDATLKNERAVEQRQADWLKRHDRFAERSAR